MAEHIEAPGLGAGSLVIIGGAEDRRYSKDILARFVALAGGPGRKIVVVTAASTVPEEIWDIYDRAFEGLGVGCRLPLHVRSRADANDATLVRELDDAGGIFMTGGDQKRLLGMIGGTALDAAMHTALQMHGACIGGTSAGASAMSGHMLADGAANLAPEKGAVRLGAGLGLVQQVVIDQHFSERHRLNRLLTIVAQNPNLRGVGIDENTALVVMLGAGIEVIGEGSVSIIDGRAVISNVADIGNGETPELIDVRLHLLPAGSRHLLSPPGAEAPHGAPAYAGTPAPLLDFVHSVTKRSVSS